MKKLIASLLAVVMLALPVLGLAASPDEMLQEAVDAGRPVSGKIAFDFGSFPGLDEETATIIDELLNALGFTFAQAGDQNSFALTLSGQDAITFAIANDELDTYVKSNLLSDKALAFNAEEGAVLLDYLKNLAVSTGIMSEADVAELEASIAQMNVPTTSVSTEDIDLTGFIATAAELALKSTTTEVTQQPKNSDAAATVTKINFTGEDVAKLYKSIFAAVQDNPDIISALNSMDGLTYNGEAVTAEELMAKLPELADQIGAMVEGEIPVEIYMDENGEIVYGIATVNMKGENNEGVESTVTVEMDYARLTINNGVTHAINTIAKDNNGEGASVSVNILESEKLTSVNVGIASIANGAAEPVVTVDVNVEKEYGETESEEDAEIAVTIIDSESKEEISFRLEIESEAKKVGEDVTYESDMDLYILGMEEELLCIKVKQETGSAPESIMDADAIRPGKMTEDEFNTFLTNDVANNAMMALMGAMQNLPTSVLMLFMAE